MKVYSVATMQLTDRAWVADYVANVTRLVEARGGRYLARTSHADVLEGDAAKPRLFLIIEWPSREVADAFYESEDYRPYRESRMAGAETDMFLVPGEDVTGAARVG